MLKKACADVGVDVVSAATTKAAETLSAVSAEVVGGTSAADAIAKHVPSEARLQALIKARLLELGVLPGLAAPTAEAANGLVEFQALSDLKKTQTGTDADAAARYADYAAGERATELRASALAALADLEGEFGEEEDEEESKEVEEPDTAPIPMLT